MNSTKETKDISYTDTYTITFCESAENHKGMQQIGNIASEGFTCRELKNIKKIFKKKGVKCKLIKLQKLLEENNDEIPYADDENNHDIKKPEQASLLIIRGGVNELLSNIDKNAYDLYKEHKNLNYDSKAFMYGRVVNKHARHNLCFADESQESAYEDKKGTVVNFDSIHLTKEIRKQLPLYTNEKASKLVAEGNYYYNSDKCFIGWHGDSERKKVIALRLGADFYIKYQWYYKTKAVGRMLSIKLKHGDMYIMSEKAVGTDWKTRNKYTLRHSASSKKE